MYKRQGVRSDQRASLWQGIEQFRGVFADIPGRTKGYECVLQVRERTPFMQRSYPVPYSKIRVVQEKLDRMMEGGIIER